MTKGRAMLLRAGTQEEIADTIGCSATLVAYWLSGRRRPSPHWRDVLWFFFSIPIGAWDLALNSPLSPTPSIRERVAKELDRWPEARSRALALLARVGIP